MANTSKISTLGYSFGTILDGRTFGILGRVGFNNKENDDEIKGVGNSLDFGSRIYDARLGRWLGVDPLHAKFPEISTYGFTLNNPIIYTDPDGKDVLLIIYATKKKDVGHAAIAVSNYKAVETKVIENGIEVTKTDYVKDGTYTFYELGPADKLKPTQAQSFGDPYYGVIQNVTKQQILNTALSAYEQSPDPLPGEAPEPPSLPDGVINLSTDYETDLKVKGILLDAANRGKKGDKYSGTANNCTDYAESAVNQAVSSSDNVDSKEEIKVPVIGIRNVSTPNALFNATEKAANATVVRDPLGKTDNSFNDAYKGKVGPVE